MRRLGLSLLVGVTALLIAACGGGAITTPSSTTPSQAAPPSAAAGSAGASSAATPSGGTGGSAAVACAKAAAGPTATVSVTIKDFKFTPQPVQAKVGDVIAWKNDDTVPHTATLADDSCGTDQIAAGSSGMLVFGVAGTYAYKCSVHPTQMNGYTIVVQ